MKFTKFFTNLFRTRTASIEAYARSGGDKEKLHQTILQVLQSYPTDEGDPWELTLKPEGSDFSVQISPRPQDYLPEAFTGQLDKLFADLRKAVRPFGYVLEDYTGDWGKGYAYLLNDASEGETPGWWNKTPEMPTPGPNTDPNSPDFGKDGWDDPDSPNYVP
jgi:hypothetical protein